MADVAVLDVLLHGEPVGTLTRVGGERVLFAFNDAHAAMRTGHCSASGSRTSSAG